MPSAFIGSPIAPFGYEVCIVAGSMSLLTSTLATCIVVILRLYSPHGTQQTAAQEIRRGIPHLADTQPLLLRNAHPTAAAKDKHQLQSKPRRCTGLSFSKSDTKLYPTSAQHADLRDGITEFLCERTSSQALAQHGDTFGRPTNQPAREMRAPSFQRRRISAVLASKGCTHILPGLTFCNGIARRWPLRSGQ